jgi:hypothetical protein
VELIWFIKCLWYGWIRLVLCLTVLFCIGRMSFDFSVGKAMLQWGWMWWWGWFVFILLDIEKILKNR